MKWPQHEKDLETRYVDVDGTLLLWAAGVGSDVKPNKALIEELRAWKTPSRRVYVWSKGGKLHAQNAVTFLGIEDIVDGCMGKPTGIIDDDLAWLGKVDKRRV